MVIIGPKRGKSPTRVELLTNGVTKEAADSNRQTFCKLLWALNGSLETAVLSEGVPRQRPEDLAFT